MLWLDVATRPPGVIWADEIERAIGKTTFYIPIVTPRFLKSQYCLDEFRSYQRRMIALGRDDLIFPVHYVDVDHIRVEDTIFGDDLTALRRSQWTDFRPLFYTDSKSLDVQRWAGRFADGVLLAMRRSPPGKAEAPAVAQAALEPPMVPNLSVAGDPALALGNGAGDAPKSDAAKPPVSPPASDAQQTSPRSTMPPTGSGQGGRSRTGPLILGAAGVALIIAAGVGILESRRPSQIPAAPASPTPTTSAPAPIQTQTPTTANSANDSSNTGIRDRAIIRVTPDFLMSLYSDKTKVQGDAAASLYIGKWLEFHGAVENVSQSSSGDIVLVSRVSPLHLVMLWIGDRDKNLASTYSMGQKIDAICQIKEADEFSVVLNNCRFSGETKE